MLVDGVVLLRHICMMYDCRLSDRCISTEQVGLMLNLLDIFDL